MTIIKPIPEVQIERMQCEDLQHVMGIEKEAFPDPWHESFFKRELRKKREHAYLYVAKLDKRVIGYIIFYIFSGEGHIYNIAVDTAYRRRGIGKYLLESALEIIEKNGVDEVFLEVSVRNTAALELYKKYHFQVFGVRKRYYSNGDDAYVLRKEMKCSVTILGESESCLSV